MAVYKNILRPVIFLHRIIDDKDFNEVVVCIPDSQVKVLEQGLLDRQVEGEIDTVQIARHRFEGAPFTDYEDEVESFFRKIDLKKTSNEDSST